jgi:arylesterase/paraoxonase
MKKVLIALLVLLLAVAGWVGHLLWSAGQFKTIAPHFAGICRAVPGVVGAEDITIHPLTGVAYISACDRRALMARQSGRGGIYAYDLTAAQPVPVKLTSGPGPDFQPHGISLYVAPDGRDALFVINHSGGTHKVEIFDLQADGLAHRRTIADPALVSPNDIVAVGPQSFYATNDHRFTGGFLKTIEDYLKLPLGNVVYFDGQGFREAAAGIGYPNGINVSADGRTVYVVGTTQMVLKIFARDIASGNLTLTESIPFDTGLDNIEIGPDGALWIAAHPQLLKFVAHSKNADKRSPSQVLRITLPTDGAPRIDEIYLNDGGALSGSSVGAVYLDRLLIGAVFEEKLLDCRMKP